MPHLSVGDKVKYQDIHMIVHFISHDAEQITCIYRTSDFRVHSIVLNARLLEKR
ncbi:hypothetical protein M2366_002077 [Aeromonas sp. BIGb0405]|jgi:hypothetical protein|nr:hypothetical protein [Aeromonas sp. BIGb0405]